MINKTTFLRSPLKRWVGSKYDFLEEIYKLVPKDTQRTIEPFSGSAVFTLNVVDGTGLNCLKGEHNRIISDSNKQIYYLFLQLKCKARAIGDKLMEYAEVHSEGFYNSVRESYNARKNIYLVDSAEEIIIKEFYTTCDFLYLHYACFNGLYRENQKGLFNVPIGKTANGGLLRINVDKMAFIKACEQLENVLVLMLDFRKTIEMILTSYSYEKTFFLIDPPYYDTYTGYSSSGFKLIDHLDLIELTKQIHEAGHYFVLFNSDNILYKEMLKGFTIRELYRKGSINSDINKRGKVKELLFTNVV